MKRASFEFLGWLPLGVVGKGPCQVVEGVGGGPEGVPSGTSRTNRKVLTPSGKGIVKLGFTKTLLKKKLFSLFIKKDKKITKPKLDLNSYIK
ncbi:hypothetical protein I6I93_06745 [Peptoniphilus harei]|uniref:hypothetical protein n=1 Tax=Peptoniphilus harei TaxID=54005 RepID=UPI000DD8506B|nr:hypothetical protein [Peptoniphilus harei]MDU2374470.1 hypothetical protein [Peptoniphilus harei]QQT90590.1 hypothetical protein I6I93_06745 [Peptoniphilus harei]